MINKLQNLVNAQTLVNRVVFEGNMPMKNLTGSIVKLTIAHMDHDKTNNDPENLRALCQRCHLMHDIGQHIANRKYGRNWKRSQLSLFK